MKEPQTSTTRKENTYDQWVSLSIDQDVRVQNMGDVIDMFPMRDASEAVERQARKLAERATNRAEEAAQDTPRLDPKKLEDAQPFICVLPRQSDEKGD